MDMATWLDDAEGMDLFGGGESAEDYFGLYGEDIDDEASRGPRRPTGRQQLSRDRARRYALRSGQRPRRAPAARPRPPASAREALRSNAAKVEEVQLDQRIQAAETDQVMKAHTRHIHGVETALGVAAVTGSLSTQLAKSFSKNALVTGALPVLAAGVPLAFLSDAGEKRDGIKGVVGKPVVWATTLAAAVAIGGEVIRHFTKPAEAAPPKPATRAQDSPTEEWSPGTGDVGTS
jgi:hypothetical protein